MIVSLANSVRFIVNDGLDPHFDNTLFRNENFRNNEYKNYCQKFLDGGYIEVQIQTTLTETVTLTKYTSAGSSVVSAYLTTTYDDFIVIDYRINLSEGDQFYMIATSDEEDGWTSEPVSVVERDGMLKVQWYNDDPNLVFEFDYSNDEVNQIYIEGILMKYIPEGEASLYDNLNELVKIRQDLSRALELKTDFIPRYLAEKLQIAMAHDVFVVNDKQYTVRELEEVEHISESNIVQVTAILTQRYVLGHNTNDLGIDCDSIISDAMVINLEKQNGSGSFQFTATAGYSINQIILKYQDGTGVTVKIGTTVGGEEILREYAVNTSDKDTLDREIALSRTSNTNIYVEVSGTNALCDVNIQTIKYTA